MGGRIAQVAGSALGALVLAASPATAGEDGRPDALIWGPDAAAVSIQVTSWDRFERAADGSGYVVLVTGRADLSPLGGPADVRVSVAGATRPVTGSPTRHRVVRGELGLHSLDGGAGVRSLLAHDSGLLFMRRLAYEGKGVIVKEGWFEVPHTSPLARSIGLRSSPPGSNLRLDLAGAECLGGDLPSGQAAGGWRVRQSGRAFEALHAFGLELHPAEPGSGAVLWIDLAPGATLSAPPEGLGPAGVQPAWTGLVLGSVRASLAASSDSGGTRGADAARLTVAVGWPSPQGGALPGVEGRLRVDPGHPLVGRAGPARLEATGGELVLRNQAPSKTDVFGVVEGQLDGQLSLSMSGVTPPIPVRGLAVRYQLGRPFQFQHRVRGPVAFDVGPYVGLASQVDIDADLGDAGAEPSGGDGWREMAEAAWRGLRVQDGLLLVPLPALVQDDDAVADARLSAVRRSLRLALPDRLPLDAQGLAVAPLEGSLPLAGAQTFRLFTVQGARLRLLPARGAGPDAPGIDTDRRAVTRETRVEFQSGRARAGTITGDLLLPSRQLGAAAPQEVALPFAADLEQDASFIARVQFTRIPLSGFELGAEEAWLDLSSRAAPPGSQSGAVDAAAKGLVLRGAQLTLPAAAFGVRSPSSGPPAEERLALRPRTAGHVVWAQQGLPPFVLPPGLHMRLRGLNGRRESGPDAWEPVRGLRARFDDQALEAHVRGPGVALTAQGTLHGWPYEPPVDPVALRVDADPQASGGLRLSLAPPPDRELAVLPQARLRVEAHRLVAIASPGASGAGVEYELVLSGTARLANGTEAWLEPLRLDAIRVSGAGELTTDGGWQLVSPPLRADIGGADVLISGLRFGGGPDLKHRFAACRYRVDAGPLVLSSAPPGEAGAAPEVEATATALDTQAALFELGVQVRFVKLAPFLVLEGQLRREWTARGDEWRGRLRGSLTLVPGVQRPKVVTVDLRLGRRRLPDGGHAPYFGFIADVELAFKSTIAGSLAGAAVGTVQQGAIKAYETLEGIGVDLLSDIGSRNWTSAAFFAGLTGHYSMDAKVFISHLYSLFGLRLAAAYNLRLNAVTPLEEWEVDPARELEIVGHALGGTNEQFVLSVSTALRVTTSPTFRLHLLGNGYLFTPLGSESQRNVFAEVEYDHARGTLDATLTLGASRHGEAGQVLLPCEQLPIVGISGQGWLHAEPTWGALALGTPAAPLAVELLPTTPLPFHGNARGRVEARWRAPASAAEKSNPWAWLERIELGAGARLEQGINCIPEVGCAATIWVDADVQARFDLQSLPLVGVSGRLKLAVGGEIGPFGDSLVDTDLSFQVPGSGLLIRLGPLGSFAIP